jgi:hypothetical protein
VPHTEVDRILRDGCPIDFGSVIGSKTEIEVFAVGLEPVTFFPEDRLQVRNVRKFVADGHLGKLVRMTFGSSGSMWLTTATLKTANSSRFQSAMIELSSLAIGAS